MRSISTGIVAAALAVLAAGRAFGLGQEEFGNEPLANQDGWSPGLLPLVNDTHRVYWSWVNGNENFYFSGDTQALNEALKKFDAVKDDGKEVILLPTRGAVGDFARTKETAFEWQVHMPSGLYLGMILREKRSDLSAHPSLTIHLGGGKIQADKLEIPAKLKVVGPRKKIETPAGEAEATAALVREGMEGAARLSVPLVVEVGIGPNWKVAKG